MNRVNYVAILAFICITSAGVNAIDGCTTVNGVNSARCQICAAGYVKSDITGLCVRCTVDNCASCNVGTPGTCTGCKDGFIASGNTCVTCNVADCKTCSAVNTCTTCMPGRFKTSGTDCTVLCSATAGATDCLNCNANKDQCVACDFGSTVDSQVCADCTTNAIAPANPNCATCTSAAKGVCSKCKITYGVDKTNSNMCRTCGTNCYDCSDDYAKCITCFDGFAKKTGDAPDCEACNEGCSVCNDGKATCSACLQGYRLDTNTCNRCTVTGCKTCTAIDADTCDACKDTWTEVMTATVRSCKKVCADTTNCAECQNDAGTCTKCNPGYLAVNGVCQKCTSPCVTCTGKVDNCATCKDGFAVDSGKCVACTNNCKTCDTIDEYCSACPTGFTINNTAADAKFCCNSADCVECTSASKCTKCSGSVKLNEDAGTCFASKTSATLTLGAIICFALLSLLF